MDEFIKTQIDAIKRSINDFIVRLSDFALEEVSRKLTSTEQEFFRFISKQIIFLKQLLENYDKYEIKVLISDFYNLIISIIKNEDRCIYLHERSIIENYTRLIVNDSIRNNYIMSNSFGKLREIKKASRIISDDEYSLIKSEYRVSCGYVHGSELLNDNLVYVFNELVSNDMPLKNRNNYFQRMIKLVKIYNRLLYFTHNNDVDNSFHRRKSVLTFLTNLANTKNSLPEQENSVTNR